MTVVSSGLPLLLDERFEVFPRFIPFSTNSRARFENCDERGSRRRSVVVGVGVQLIRDAGTSNMAR